MGPGLHGVVFPDRRSGTLPILVFWLTAGIAAAAPTVPLSGKVADEKGDPVAGAHIILAGPIAAGQLEVRSDSQGQFEIRSLSPGSYQLEVLAEGFFPERRQIEISRDPVLLELTLARSRLEQKVDVVSTIFGVDPQQTSRTRTLTQEQMDHVPYTPTYDFRKALAILPGVATDSRGRLHVYGGGSDQTLYLLDGFNLTDPVTGTLENNFSVEGVRAADVRSSRYSAEYGKGSAGVISVITQTGDDRFRHHFTDFIPSFDTKKGKGGFYLKDWAPRVTLSGPVVKNRVWFLNAFDAKYDKDFLPGLPDGGDETTHWRFNNLMRLQAQLGPSHLLSASYLHNQGHLRNFGLDLFNPVETTRNIDSRSHFISVKDQRYWRSGLLVELGFGINRLDLRKDPLGDEPFIVEPDQRRGNFFLRTRRESERQQWMVNLAPKPLYGRGRHDLKFGVDFDRVLYHQFSQRRPFETFRAPGVPWRRTTFAGSPDYTRNNLEWSSYLQDRWSPVDRLLVEVGLRHDWDRVVDDQLLSPRLAVALVPWAGRDIKISAGVGLFHDATNLAAVSRSLDQRQFDTFLNPNGSLSWGPAETVFRTHWDALRAPRVVNWSAGWEQKLRQGLAFRVTYLQKRGANGFTIQNLLRDPAPPFFAIYELENARRDRYRAVELAVSQMHTGRHRWMASYVRSSARSNAVLDYTIDNPFFPGQGPGPMDWDIPNRVVASGWTPVRKNFTFSYLVEWRDGTPFSVIDDTQELVGLPNRMRLPMYFTLNTHVEHEFVAGRYRLALRVGVNNVTDHDNFSMVFNNIASPKFLTYGAGERRSLNFRFRYLGRK